MQRPTIGHATETKRLNRTCVMCLLLPSSRDYGRGKCEKRVRCNVRVDTTVSQH